ncbi:MAG: polysaccharide biosynthesis tyrosine autokinase [Verrucomicrobiota bacterium]
MNDNITAVKSDRSALMNKFHARLERYRNLLLRRWWIFLLTVPVAVGVEKWQLSKLPTEFTSVGQMIVNIKVNTQSIGTLYTEELGNFLGTQSALMQGQAVQSRARARVASENPGLAQSYVRMDVSLLPKTTIFILRATGAEPQYTQKFLQACMVEYNNMKKEMATHASDVTVSGLSDQIQKLDPELNRIDDQLTAFLSTNDAALFYHSTTMNSFLTVLYQRLAETESQYSLLSAMTLDQSLLLEQSQATTLMRNGAGEIAPAGSILVNEQVGMNGANGNGIGMQYLSIKQQILLLKADKERFAEFLKPQHPRMVSMGESIDRLGRMLVIYRAQSIEQLEARKSALAFQITNLQSQCEQIGRDNVVLARKGAEYERLQKKSQRVQGLREQLLNSLQMLDVNKEVNPESVTIYQVATDAQPQPPLMLRSLLMAGLFGIGLGLGLLLIMDRLDDRMHSFTELQEFFDEEVIGQIPRETSSPGSRDLPLLTPGDQRTAFVESFRNLRSSLVYLNQNGQRPARLMITSSVPNDGKSLTAANLSVTLAGGGSRVLLVDADLRKGSLHKRFNLVAENGLSQMLVDKTDWHSLVLTTKIPNLGLLPRGRSDKRSTEYFFAADMENFMNAAGKEYDYIIVDTPPVMAADDAATLAPRMDGVIFVVRAEATSARVARASLDMLIQRKAKVLGLVLNSVRAGSGAYHYYDYYKDYHKGSKE